MMIAKGTTEHVVWLDRRTVDRMLCGAQTRQHFAQSAETARHIGSFANYLRQSLRVRGEKIEMKGPLHWFAELARACGDTTAAMEIGRQLQRE